MMTRLHIAKLIARGYIGELDTRTDYYSNPKRLGTFRGPSRIGGLFLKSQRDLRPLIMYGPQRSMTKEEEETAVKTFREMSIILSQPFLDYVFGKIQNSKTTEELHRFMSAITQDPYWDIWMQKNYPTYLVNRTKLNRVENAAYDALSNPYNPFGRARILKIGKSLETEAPRIQTRIQKRSKRTRTTNQSRS